MTEKVKPLKVSPLIKCARYGFLILGIVYGNMHLRYLRVYESKMRVIRQKMLHEKHERIAKEVKERTVGEILSIAKEFEVKEMPPDWDRDI